MTFSEALDRLKAGQRIERSGWNGRGMWLVLIDAWTPDASRGGWPGAHPPAPFIAMETATDTLVPWLASQTDLLAEDWQVVA